MQNAEQVQTLLDDCQTRGLSKAATVEQLAVACLGWPYVFGRWAKSARPRTGIGAPEAPIPAL